MMMAAPAARKVDGRRDARFVLRLCTLQLRGALLPGCSPQLRVSSNRKGKRRLRIDAYGLSLQGYLAHQNLSPARTPHKNYVQGPTLVLWGGAFFSERVILVLREFAHYNSAQHFFLGVRLSFEFLPTGKVELVPDHLTFLFLEKYPCFQT